MHSILVEGPAVEPVTLAEMKTYLRVDDDTEDDLIAGLVKAARLMVEAVSGRILIAQRWRVILDAWPANALRLPLSPLIAVERIALCDSTGASEDVALDLVEVNRVSDPPRLLAHAALIPGHPRNGIHIDVTVGHGATPEEVPEPLRLAAKILVARWFENRGDVIGAQRLPPEALALIAPFQRSRL